MLQVNNKEESLKINILYQIFYQILTLIVPLITAPYISRVLGKDGMGVYSYTYAIANYFVIFTMLGILNHGNREIASHKDNIQERSQSFWNIFLIHFLFGCFVLIIYVLLILYVFDQYRTVFLVQTVFIVSAVLDISWLYFGLEKFRMTTLVSCANKIVTTLLVFLFVNNKDDICIYVAIIAGGALLNNIVYWLFLKKQVIFCKPHLRQAKNEIKPLLILFIPVIAVSVYKYMDKIMLGMITTTADVGIYEAAEKFINLPMCVISALGTVMLPRITNLKAKEDTKKVEQYNYISMIFVMFSSMGMAFGLAGISHSFIPWFYGEDFIDSSDVLLVLLPSIIFVSWANVIRTQYLLPNKKDKAYCASVISGAILNFGINSVLIPIFGVLGAAIGTTFAELFVCLVQTFNARKEMKIITYFVDSVPYLLTGTLMMIVISKIIFSNIMLTVLMRIFIGIMLYVLLSVIPLKRSVRKYHSWNESGEKE